MKKIEDISLTHWCVLHLKKNAENFAHLLVQERHGIDIKVDSITKH